MDRNADELLTPLMPSITLRWPRTGDVLMAGRREVLYDFASPRGAAVYELVVNDSLQGSFPAGVDGSQPSIIWQVDTALVSSEVQYFLRVYDHDGNTTTSSTMKNIRVMLPTLPPAAPRNLSLSRISDSAVNLTWEDDSDNESSFELWRSQAGGPFVRVQILATNSVSTNDTGLAGGVLYRYRVRAVNPYGFGESNEASLAAELPVPDAPTNLVGTARGTRQVELQWSDNSSNELGFVIQRRISTGTAYSQIGLVGPNEQAFTDTSGLAGGSSYTYRVAARGQYGQSAWSNEETVTTLYQDVFPPTGLAGSYETASRSVKLTWKDNTVFEIQTRIERRTNPAGLFVEIGQTGVDVTTYRDSTVTAGLTYTYRVRAYTAGDYYTQYSNESTVTIPAGSSPDPAMVPRSTRGGTPSPALR